MKIIKGLLFFIAGLFIFFCIFIVICAYRPDISERIGDFLSPEKDRSVTAEIDDASAGINSIPSETDNKKCISCMRCIAVCPQKARSVSKALLTAGSMMLKKECSGYKENELFL